MAKKEKTSEKKEDKFKSVVIKKDINIKVTDKSGISVSYDSSGYGEKKFSITIEEENASAFGDLIYSLDFHFKDLCTIQSLISKFFDVYEKEIMRNHGYEK